MLPAKLPQWELAVAEAEVQVVVEAEDLEVDLVERTEGIQLALESTIQRNN